MRQESKLVLPQHLTSTIPSPWVSSFEKLVTYQLAHTNHYGLKKTAYSLIPEPSGPKIIAIGRLQPVGNTGDSLNNVMSKPTAIHYEQVTTAVDRRGHGDYSVSIESMESRPDVQRGGKRQIHNDGIRMNPPGTIGGN